MFTTRAYNEFEIFPNKGTLVKTSNTDRLANEIEFYKKIPKQLQIWFPRIVSSNTSKKINKLEMELYPYSNLGDFITKNNSIFTNKNWETIAKTLEAALQDFEKHSIQRSIVQDMDKMYIKKTWKEYKNLVENFEQFYELSKYKDIVVNGKVCLNFENFWEKYEKDVEDVLFKEIPKASFTHGDLCFSNILIGTHEKGFHVMKMIDPRGKFGDIIGYGDPAYDYAKLMHSTEGGYEYFINDQFNTVSRYNSQSFTIHFSNQRKRNVHEIFHDVLYNKLDQQKIRLIQALIFIGMCARHYDNFDRQLTMYLTGIKLLNKTFE